MNENEILRRHRAVYETPFLKPFGYDVVMERVLAGRNPLTAHDVAEMAGQGVTHILDLREAHEWKAPKFGLDALHEIERRGLTRLHLIVEDMGAPTPQAFDEAVRFLEEALAEKNHRVYVHCRAGMERTAAILVAYYAHKNGVSYETALAHLREKRPIFCPLPNQERAARKWLQSRHNAEYSGI